MPRTKHLVLVAALGSVLMVGQKAPALDCPHCPGSGSTTESPIGGDFGTGVCATCHISVGQGRGVGPELTEVGLRRNARYLRRALTDPDADAPMLDSRITGRIFA